MRLHPKPHSHKGAARIGQIEYDRKKAAGWQMEYEHSVEAAIKAAGLP